MKPETIEIRAGVAYTPERGKPPVCPCETCKEKDLARFGECNRGWGVCVQYMDYEYKNAIYKRTVFD